MVVWDLLRLKGSKDTKSFTKHPHLTLSIGAENSGFHITIPHNMKKTVRKHFIGETYDEFEKIMLNLVSNLTNVFKIDSSAQPVIKVIQRHYKSQSSPPITDAYLICDIKTAIKGNKPEKYQPEWLRAIYEVIKNKKSNIQLMFGIEIHYKNSKVIQTPKALNFVEESFIGLLPLLERYEYANSKD